MGLDSGARLGPYEVRGLLGAGGMGEVYRARDPRLGRDVAIKVLPASASADAARLRRFEQEARAAGTLNHANVLVVFDIGVHEGAPYVVSELLEGETLRERLRAGGLPLQKAIQYGAQIANGLAAAHEKGIVHRDLKPENLFLTKDGRVKILDFGLAKLRDAGPSLGEGEAEEAVVSDTTESGVVLGTVGYMSPEQVRGLPVDPRSDIFSFGTVLSEMIVGRRVFQRPSAAETMAAILKEDPPELGTPERPVPPGLERIVKRCLEKDRERRFHSAHDLAFALEDLSGTRVALSAKEAAPSARRRGVRAALVLGVVALAAVAFVSGRRTAERLLPSFQRLTFRRGAVMSARYAPDGQTVVYAAGWDGDPKLRLYSTHVGSPESQRLELPEAGLLGISRTGELALALDHPFAPEGFWTGTLARVPLAGGTPRSVLDAVNWADWSPDGSGFAVVRIVGGRARLEFPIGTTLYEDEAIGSPRISPRGDRIAFFHGPAVNYAGGALAVVDRSGKKTELSGGWKWTGGLAWAPSGNEVWFTASKGGAGWTQELYAVTLSGRQRLVMRVPSWTILQDVTPDGRALLTLGTLRMRTTCLAPGATHEHDVSWFDSSKVEDLTPDGKLMLFSEHGASSGRQGALYVTKTAETAAPMRLGEVSLGGSLSPDGRWAVVRNPHEIVLLPTGAGEARRFPTGDLLPEAIRYFRDGKRCVLMGKEPGHRLRTYSLDIETGKIEPLTPEGFASVYPSPDGRELIGFDEDLKWSLYSLERRESRPVPGLGTEEDVLDWASDGFAYVRPRNNSKETYRLDLRNGKRTLWRRIVIADPAGLIWAGPDQEFVAPAAGAYCYTSWWALWDLYQVNGLE